MFPQRLCMQHLKQVLKHTVRNYSGSGNIPHVCVVGSGPAGFYTAQQLLKGNNKIHVDIYEKLPVPFGLVRYGVAPDHPEVKNVINTFTQTANNERCTFIGNVCVGQDISLSELQKCYTAVILSYGAEDDRKLNIPGEDVQNVVSARNFVGWYNGLPEDKNLDIDLDTDVAVILGVGNVALDVARILLTPIDILAKTDITEYSLERLRKSHIKRVILVGRRGPLQVAFTIKELREMIKLPGCRPVLHTQDYTGLDSIYKDLPRPRKRLTELMYKTAITPTETDYKLWNNATKEWELRFRLSPLEILHDGVKASGVKFGVNRLEGSDMVNQKCVLTDETESVPCGLVLRSIGYRSHQIDSSLPFDVKNGVIDNTRGRVKDMKGIYCSGWVGTGPVGVILGTMTDGFDVGKTVLKDLDTGLLDTISNREDALQLLQRRGVKTVSFKDWNKIDMIETTDGENIGKPREKIADIDKLLNIAHA
ncbi:hypothetical protein ACF0H5_000132 [Mactra antiquata]